MKRVVFHFRPNTHVVLEGLGKTVEIFLEDAGIFSGEEGQFSEYALRVESEGTTLHLEGEQSDTQPLNMFWKNAWIGFSWPLRVHSIKGHFCPEFAVLLPEEVALSFKSKEGDKWSSGFTRKVLSSVNAGNQSDNQ